MTPTRFATAAACALALLAAPSPAISQVKVPNMFAYPNASGILQTNNTNGNGQIDFSGPFFQALGSNGRSCFSCHRPDQAWTISAQAMAQLFNQTAGTDPVFRTVDGSNCDHNIDTSTADGRRRAYSLLTTRGLIRIALAVPATAEYQVVGVTNPYGCTDPNTLSTYRRPLPSTNLRFLSAVMWDGRESTPPSTQKITFVTNPTDLNVDLSHQSFDAVSGHAEGTIALTPELQKQIVDFETHLFTAQSYDNVAGSLREHGANGGPLPIGTQPFYIGINDPLGGNPTNTPFSAAIFNLYDAWNGASGDAASDRRASIARGQKVFNTKAINITGVAGLNDTLGLTVIPGNCGTCHSSPNAGNHSVSLPINIGVGDLTNSLGVSYLPVITLRNIATGDIKQTTDPGRALVTGKWADVGKFKGPVLRGLAARAPYFHNGSAQTLSDVVDFYNVRFAVGFTAQEKTDLIAFLSAL